MIENVKDADDVVDMLLCCPARRVSGSLASAREELLDVWLLSQTSPDLVECECQTSLFIVSVIRIIITTCMITVITMILNDAEDRYYFFSWFFLDDVSILVLLMNIKTVTVISVFGPVWEEA